LKLWVFVLGACAASLLVAAACLPDLTPIPAIPDASEAPQALSACGDGVVETLDDGGDAGESCDPGDASVPGCEACAFTCPGTLDDAGHCYFALEPSRSILAANGACGALGAHVVTLASDREAALAATVAGGAEHWIGLVRRSDFPGNPYVPRDNGEGREPGWRRSCAGCYAQGASDGGSFAVHPDAGASPDCLVASGGRWLQVGCDGPNAFATVCEREPVGARAFFCGGPYCTTLPVTAGTKRYVFGPVVDAKGAEEFCAAFEEGRLVTFDSREEREQLVREILTRFKPPLEVWIGLARVGPSFRWDDGVAADGTTRPLPWGADQPDAGSRAFLRVDADLLFDTQLAYVGDDAPRIVACQRR